MLLSIQKSQTRVKLYKRNIRELLTLSLDSGKLCCTQGVEIRWRYLMNNVDVNSRKRGVRRRMSCRCVHSIMKIHKPWLRLNTMQTLDFGRSFMTFRIDTLNKPPATVTHKPPFSLNNARVQIECRLRLHDKKSDSHEEFFLGASCKTERVGVERDIWTQPNADFAPVFSSRQYLHIKTYDRVGCQVPLYPPTRGMQNDRPTGFVETAFDSVRLDIATSNALILDEAEAVIEATLDNQPLVAQTQIENERYKVALDYPVKTINVNERDGIYQTDTGPVLLPDFDCDWNGMLDGFNLAFSAFNCRDWIEFLVRQPSSVADNVKVWHYNQSRRFDCVNHLYQLVPSPELRSGSDHINIPHFTNTMTNP